MRVAASLVCLLLQSSLGLPAQNDGDRAFLRGDYAEAERYFREACRSAEAEHAPEAARASAIASLAQVTLTLGRPKESEELFNLALESTANRTPDDPKVRAIALLNFSALLYLSLIHISEPTR